MLYSAYKLPLHKFVNLFIKKFPQNYNIMEETDFQEDFKCPICFEIPPSEIFQCKNGHILCASCSHTLQECPQCRVTYENTKIRTRALESMLDKMRFDCPFKSQGCKEKCRRNEILSHSEKCSFGNIGIKFCRQLGYHCDYLFNSKSLQEAIKHFQEQHHFLVCRDICASIRIEGLLSCTSKGFWTPIIFNLEAKGNSIWILFFLIDFENKSISPICVQLKNVEDLQKPRIEFVIQGNESGEIPEIIWNNQLLSIKQAQFALLSPLIQLPMQTIFSFYLKHGSLSLKCFTNITGSTNFENMELKAFSIFQTLDIDPNPNIFPDIDTIQHIFPTMPIGATSAQTTSSVTQNLTSDSDIIFIGTHCKVCGRTPESIRYSCLECEDYDLCKICMDKKLHCHHVFTVITNFEQQGLLTSIMFASNERTYFPEITVLMLKASSIFATRKLKCSKCQNKYSIYICLQCRRLYGLCERCWLISSSEKHAQDHLFAFGNNQAKLNLIIGYHDYQSL